MVESQGSRYAVEYGRQAPVEPHGRRVLLLGHQGDSPLRALHRGRPAWSDSAYMDVAKHFRVGVDGDRDFCRQGKKHPHDPSAFRPPRYRRWTIAREGLEFFPGWLSKPISAVWRRLIGHNHRVTRH